MILQSQARKEIVDVD
jgi:hypothetical protein